MGDVVSIKKSLDDDLHELFVQACPEVPSFVNEKVQNAVNHSLGGGVASNYQPSFRTVCFIVAGACLLGAGLVKGFTARWSDAVDSAAMYTAQSESLNKEAVLGAAMPGTASETGDSAQSWRRSKGAWAEYIARLERDPFYQHVQQEKLRFQARYPSTTISPD